MGARIIPSSYLASRVLAGRSLRALQGMKDKRLQLQSSKIVKFNLNGFFWKRVLGLEFFLEVEVWEFCEFPEVAHSLGIIPYLA